MEKLIKVHYGLHDIVTATLLEEVSEGILKGWIKLRMADGHECYMSSRWRVMEDTDWRSFLKAHWDQKRNCLQADYCEEFMRIFTNAASEYYKTLPKQQFSTPKAAPKPEPKKAKPQPTEKKKQRYTQLSLFD